ncbi:MAG TPA: FG-GAP-like repeat-containing protein [Pyrinomonadaceae bacterium]|nr:FG-GAP-like repeat-containing protein [Pyrinomonadaceae bacterium]
MKTFKRFSIPSLILVITLLATLTGSTQTKPTTAPATPLDAREDAYRANNLGVALLEQYKYKEGAESFTRALQLDPRLQLARINLSIALFNVPDLTGAQREAEKAAAANPAAPQPHYILGLIAKAQNRADEAVAAFQRVLKIDPRDTGANVNLGQLYVQQKRYAEAIAAFRTAISVEPYNMTALYNLGLALTRNNERAEGQQMIQRFQQLRQSGAGTTIGQNYLEQGRYAEAIASTGAESELIERAVPEVKFTDATESMLPGAAAVKKDEGRWSTIPVFYGASATLFDFDVDGDLDLLSADPTGMHLYRNDGGKFSDVTEGAGALKGRPAGMGGGAIAGDYDNDGRPDLFISSGGASTLYHNDGGGKFSDVTAASGISPYKYLSISTAFVDADHDGDLDIFIAGFADLSKGKLSPDPINLPEDFAGAPNVLLRNDGTGKFTDVTVAAKVGESPNHAMTVVPTDYDNRRDIDLLVVNYGAPSNLFSNQRDGSFRDVAKEVGLDAQGHGTSAAAGDLNKDGFTDFFFGGADAAGLFALSDGQGKFKTAGAPASTKGTSAAQFLDYDNDGLLDCVMLTGEGLRVLRNLGTEWADVSDRAVARELTSAAKINSAGRTLASGDLDGDGDTDLVLRSSTGELRIARNDGGNLNRSLRVNLLGKVSNRSAVGAKVEARAASLVQKLETYSASPAPAPSDLIFGLGKRSGADAVRVLWPAGIVQAETEVAARPADPKRMTSTLPVTELDRKPSSCPYLYTWNGERFEFVTDFMGGGEMGYWEAPGHYNTPDPDEYVRIRNDQLKERDGRFELRVTNELEEVLYVDRLQLIAVAHPAGTEVYPNEGMTTPPRPFQLYTTRGARPPLSATDDHGHDVLSRIARMDRRYPDDFPLERIRGYAGEHGLTMKLSEGKGTRGRTLLLLTGWTDYAFSSDNVAASHSGLQTKLPALQVKDARGRWRTVIEDIGIPVGRPQTVTVDLTGKFLSASREVRIITSLRVYWDQILVDTSSSGGPVQMTRLDPVSATLRWRGYSREVTPDGREPFGYDYEQVSSSSPWKAFPGRYTREGDVRGLLLKTDDIFVISRTGDELSLSFDARSLPKLPEGWTRTFLLYSDGYSKEMDINSASPDEVLPLPFHGMKRYPYRAPEVYPMTAERRACIERYNTRIVAAPVPLIETTLVNEINKSLMNAKGRREE